MKLADRQVAQAGELQPGCHSYIKLYAAGLADEEPDAADPELLLNYSLTAKQFWDAGRSFESITFYRDSL